MKLRKLAVGAVALSAILLQGCSTGTTAAGSWGVDAPGQPQLTLGEDGHVSGTDGCNRIMGSWEESGDSIELSELASTMMACEGVDTWLSGAQSLRVEGDTLHVLGTDGDELGTLQRG